MDKNKRILALIPARGGSKGLLGKNIMPLCGKPLIAYTIESARNSKYITKVVVSTDSKDIRQIAIKFGAEVPFIRPSELATDTSSSIDSLIHAVNYFKRESREDFDMVAMLQPTSPLRQTIDIDNAVRTIISKDAQAIISVCQSEHHPWWSNTLPENLSMKNFLKKDIEQTNRQALPVYYRLNGAIFLVKTDYLLTNKSFYGDKTYAYVMPMERSIDIDSKHDFKIAEFYINNQL